MAESLATIELEINRDSLSDTIQTMDWQPVQTVLLAFQLSGNTGSLRPGVDQILIAFRPVAEEENSSAMVACALPAVDSSGNGSSVMVLNRMTPCGR